MARWGWLKKALVFVGKALLEKGVDKATDAIDARRGADRSRPRPEMVDEEADVYRPCGSLYLRRNGPDAPTVPFDCIRPAGHSGSHRSVDGVIW